MNKKAGRLTDGQKDRKTKIVKYTHLNKQKEMYLKSLSRNRRFPKSFSRFFLNMRQIDRKIERKEERQRDR